MILSIASKLAAMANMTPTKSSALPSQQNINEQPNSIPTTMEIQEQSSDKSMNNEQIINDIQHNNNNLTETDQDMNSLKSILKPKSISLEPKDLRAKTKSNSPRKTKVQFTVKSSIRQYEVQKKNIINIKKKFIKKTM